MPGVRPEPRAGKLGGLRLRVLGSVELVGPDGRLLDPGPPKQSCVLAVLGLSAGRPVAPGVLIDHVWGERSPLEARNVLYTYIARLRRVIRTGAPGASGVLRRQTSGYVLDLSRDHVDALRFLDAVEAARGARDERRQWALLSDALALWQGPALAGLSGEWAETTRTALTRARLAALADRVDLEVRGGGGEQLVAELTALVAEYPLDERFTGQLMLVLHRADRTAEALATYEHCRRRLAEELGQDPGTRLRELHQRILRQDPGLRRRPDERAVPRQLPAGLTGFVGREEALAALVRGLTAAGGSSAPVFAIHGPGGAGKTALALRAAHAISEHFPDGHLYVDMRGSGPERLEPLAGLELFLRALGVANDAIARDTAEAAAQLRSLVSARRVLVVIDNAADAAQVRPLLPAGAGCGVVITSRSAMSTLDNTVRVGLGVLSPEESVAVLERFDQSGRIAAARSQARVLARLCGHLPLALRIAAARVETEPDLPLDRFVETLARAEGRLDQLGVDDLSVRASLEVSYRAMDDRLAHAFRHLGLPAGPDISLPLAARLVGTTEDEAARTLADLVAVGLLNRSATGRYQIHDLVRLYAAELTLDEVERGQALRRTWRCYIATAVSAGQLLRPGYREGLVRCDPADALPLRDDIAAAAWLGEERANLLAAADQARGVDGDPTTIALAHALFGPLHSAARWVDLERLNKWALDLARERGDRRAEAQVQSDLAIVAWRADDIIETIERYRRSARLYREVGDQRGEAASLHNLGNVHAVSGRHDEAELVLGRALDLHRAAGYRTGEAATLTVLSEVHQHLGQTDRAVRRLRRALDIYRELGDRVGEVEALGDLGSCLSARCEMADAAACHESATAVALELDLVARAAWNMAEHGEAARAMGDREDALSLCRRALELSRDHGAEHEAGWALWRLGSVLDDLGRRDDARRHWREALAIFERRGAHEVEEVRALLDIVDAS
ncbi:MAG: tetratricopeptide repeat protein [Actinophytocola sp.]|uniref:AfsR/SARP family transcriptional regulator n=1 Tax=Actinophytocola sp. TaxID=1872138 RepID=UPI0013272F8F|nr:BTAD domain-containing putative transcriptional regulator [Actinophytocola sp.]MPZ86043.1 tetratricopeptide repeat protein [Actinophytocola sp.]